MIHRIAIPFVLLLIAISPLAAQTDEPVPDGLETEIGQGIEPLSGESREDDALPDLLERYLRNPIDLYSTTAEELARLPDISLRQAIEILRFIDRYSPNDISQLDTLEGMTPDRMTTLRTYTRLPTPVPAEDRLTFEIRSRISTDLQPRKGYTDAQHRIAPLRDPISGDSLGLDTIDLGHSYLGNRLGISTRIGGSYGGWSAGITVEKDPGEPILVDDTTEFTYGAYEPVDSNRGAIRKRLTAFVSGHLSADLGPVEIHIGDYSLEFGQGLLFWGGYGGYKGGNVATAPYKSGRGVVDYRSTGESRFFRGGALTLHTGNERGRQFEGNIFSSFRTLDASLRTGVAPNGDTIEEVSSFRTDGYHRTHNEIRRSANLDETLIGGNLGYRTESGHIGLTGYISRYDHPIGADTPYDFSGTRLTMVGADGTYRIGATWVYGEIARSTGGAIAGSGGIATEVSGAEMVVAGRYFPADFHTPHGSGFGESPIGQHNERGIYIGLQSRIAQNVLLRTYFDLYSVPERTFTVPFPYDGIDGMIRCEYAVSPRLRLALQLRNETKGEAATVEDAFGREVRRVQDRTTTSGRFDVGYSSQGNSARLRARFERTHVAYSETLPSVDGTLTYLDMILHPVPSLRLGGRIVFFRTDDYVSRIYEFENELPGRLIGSALYGEGRRCSVTAAWRPTGTLTLSFSYTETVYSDRTTISPGTLQELSGRIDNTMAAQIDVSW